MSIEQGLNTYLRANVPSVSNRVYPLRAPQTVAMPYLVYRRISTPQDYAHGRLMDPTPGPTGIQTPRFQIDGFAATFAGMRQIANEVRAALSGYVGMMGAVRVASSRVVTEMDVYDHDPAAPDSQGAYRIIMDVFIGYQL